MSIDTQRVRHAHANDLDALLELYAHFQHVDEVPSADDWDLADFWHQALANPMLHYLVIELDGRLAASSILAVIPNLTRGVQPYGLIENVVTHPDFRRRGLGTAVLRRALEIAWDADCYKVTLLAGRDEPWVHAFYQRAGFSKRIRTGFEALAPADD